MSIKAMNHYWGDRPDIDNQSDLLVLIALADWANDEGTCFPSYSGIAKKCRTSKRTAMRTVKRLIDSGEIEVVIGGGMVANGGRTNLFILCSFQNVTKCQNVTRGSDKMSPSDKGVTPPSDKGDTPPSDTAVSPEPPIEPPIEPSVGSPNDFSARVLAEFYSNPVPGWVWNTNQNPEVAIEDFYDRHDAVVARYGESVYRDAVSKCVKDSFRDGRKADHVEHHAQQIAPAQQNANGRARMQVKMINGVAELVPIEDAA